jgi:hypothetical protein
MSPVSDSIKTSILFGLAILFVHLLAKNHVAKEQAANGQGFAPPSRPAVTTWDTAAKAEEFLFEEPKPKKAAITAAVADVASDAADVLDYVFGPANMVSSLPSLPPPPSAAATPSVAATASPPKDQESATSGLHLVIGSYDNESTMCGGRIFEGAGTLQGFDDSDSAFAAY